MSANVGGNEATGGDLEGQAGEATMLVSEFPPPPFYYAAAANLTPPPIPKEALELGTRRAAAAAARARAEAEKQRLAEAGEANTANVLGGVEEKEEEGDVVAVFGEIVEDPLKVEPLDNCEDPTIIRDEIEKLNREAVQGFVKLVQDLVHRPAENKKRRDELSHKIFCMLLEANKFREHQAREILIELLEKQLEGRQKLLKEVQADVARVDALLGDAQDMDES